MGVTPLVSRLPRLANTADLRSWHGVRSSERS